MRPEFPDPVDEVSARLVAAGVVLQSIVFLLTGSTLVLAAIAAGFALRVLWGLRFPPLGRLVTKVVRPRLDVAPRFVAGAPKRFAEGVGLAFSGSALVTALVGVSTAPIVIIGALIGAATLEAAFGICLGCHAFRLLMRAGVVPSSVCESCNDISAHLAALAARQGSPARSGIAA